MVLSKKHGVAPALTFCRICGKDTNEIAMLGAMADRIMKEVCAATNGRHGSENGYSEYGYNRIPAKEPCGKCSAHLKSGGTILIASDIEQFLKLDAAQIEQLHGRVADAKGRFLDFKAMAGKVLTVSRAFWIADGDNIRLRDPKEWTDYSN